jgi:hypothetical protein
MRLEGWVGTRLEDCGGMSSRLTPLTPRGYHRPSKHNSPLQPIRSWTESTPASEGWSYAQVKCKIHSTLMCRTLPSGTNSSSNSLGTSTRCCDNNRRHRCPTCGPWGTTPDTRPSASLGEDLRRGTLYLSFCIFIFRICFYLLAFKKSKNLKIPKNKI